MAYFFEEESADVIREILKSDKNGLIDIHAITDEIIIDDKILASFFGLLMSHGLLVSSIPTEDNIKVYRNNVRLSKQEHVKQTIQEFQDLSSERTAQQALHIKRERRAAHGAAHRTERNRT